MVTFGDKNEHMSQKSIKVRKFDSKYNSKLFPETVIHSTHLSFLSSVGINRLTKAGSIFYTNIVT